MATSRTTPSCLSCPSYLNPTEVAEKFGKSINGSACARFGNPIERPGASVRQNRASAEQRAKDCAHFGEGRPVRVPDRPAVEVALYDPEARQVLSDLDDRKTLVRNCSQCTNFVPDSQVHTETGWVAGMCRAKGRLVPSNRRTEEARGCEFRAVGRQRSAIDLPLLPIYTSVDRAEEARMARADDSLVEPLDYVSDRTVTVDEEELGIKAWREIQDPDGSGNSVMLPIFETKSFSDREQALIPKTGGDERPELYHDHNGAVYLIAVLWMELDEIPALWGQPGLGKTEIMRHLAWLMQVPFYRFSIKEATELYELEGSKEYSPEIGTSFQDGRFTIAWGSRGVMVVDEPNLGRPEVWAFLRPCMDNSKQLILDSDGGRLVQRNDFAFLGLAMNPDWSPLNVGTSPIGAADASRLMHIEFSYPPENVERRIIQNRVKVDGWKIDDTRLTLVMSISEKIRELSASGDLSITWGTRENLKVSRALRWFTPVTAYRMAAADYLEPAQREMLLDQVKAVAPRDLPAVVMV